MANPPLQHPRERVPVLHAVATMLNVVPYAMLSPQVTVRLAEAGYSATEVGIYAIAPFVVILGLSPVLSAVVDRLGLERAHTLGISVGALAIIGTSLLFWQDVTQLDAYLILAIPLGFATAFTWTSTEAMIAQRTPLGGMGATMSAYQLSLGLSFAAGPFLPEILMLGSFGMVVTTMVLMGAALAISLGAPSGPKGLDARPKTVSGGLRVVRAALPLIIVAAIGGAFELGLNGVLPHAALQQGIEPDMAVMLVGTLAVGALIIQVPLALFSDRVSTALSKRLAVFVVILGCASLAFSPQLDVALWVSAFAFGAGGAALYTIVMIDVGRSRETVSVATMTTAAVAAYTFGAVMAPLIGGPVVDWIGPDALWIALSAIAALALLSTLTEDRPL